MHYSNHSVFSKEFGLYKWAIHMNIVHQCNMVMGVLHRYSKASVLWLPTMSFTAVAVIEPAIVLMIPKTI